jgi:hypothetical protein
MNEGAERLRESGKEVPPPHEVGSGLAWPLHLLIVIDSHSRHGRAV